MSWLRDVAKAVDKVTRFPLEFLRRRAIRNAAREKLKKNDKKEEQDK